MASSAKAASPLAAMFKLKERKGTIKGEVAAGFTMALLSVCGIFMNVQLLATLSLQTSDGGATATQTVANGEVYASLYFAAMIMAFVGSLVIGLITRLPLVQVSGMGLSSVLVSTVGAATGLTYYNLLFVCLVSSVVYAVCAGVPVVRNFIFNGLPKGVRRALPAAAGLLIVWVAAQLSGVISVEGSDMPIYGAGTNSAMVADNVSLGGLVSFADFDYTTDKFHPQMMLAGLSGFVAVIIYLVIRRRAKHPFLTSLVVATAAFIAALFLLCGINWKNMKIVYDWMWGRVWMIGSEDAMQAHLSAVLGSFSIGAVLTQGTDFSAYTEAGGNVVLLFASGLITFVFINYYESEAVLSCVIDDREATVEGVSASLVSPERAGAYGLPMLVNAATGVVAALVGVPPLSIGAESVAGRHDGGKSGLSSVVASVVFLVSAFVMILPALFASVYSYSIAFSLYGHYGTSMALFCQCSFVAADAVMALVGVMMVVRTMGSAFADASAAARAALEGAAVDASRAELAAVAAKAVRPNATEVIALIVTMVATLLMGNIALGVAFGTVASALCAVLPPRAKRGAKKRPLAAGLLARLGGVPGAAWAVVCLLLIVLSLVA